jgi:hypothetical protein
MTFGVLDSAVAAAFLVAVFFGWLFVRPQQR